MKQLRVQRQRAVAAAILAALCALAAAACNRAKALGESAAVNLPAGWFTVRQQEVRPNAKGLVFLIGENHESVQGQVHLAKVLRKLLDEKRIGAVLVEGSNGKIEADSLREAVTRDFTPDQLERYWQRELEEGRLAGYEYVALVSSGLRVQGIEDMKAKHRFEVTMTGISERWLQDELAAHDRAVASLGDGIAALPAAAASELPSLERGLASYRDAASSYATAARDLAAANEPSNESRLALLDLYFSYDQVIDGIGRDEIQEVQRKPAAEIQQFWERHSGEVDRLRELGAAIDERKAQLAKEQEALKAPLAGVAKLAQAVRDRYFELANAILDAGRRHCGPSLERCPADVRARLERVDHFFGEDLRRSKEERERTAPAELAERDQRMSANVVAFMKESGIDRVAVIVGAAHLPGMMAGLRAQPVSLVAGALNPLESGEKWEEAAWSARRHDQEAVFASASPEGLKEVSRLLSEIWRREQEARLAFLEQARAGGTVAPVLSVGKEALFERVGNADGERVLLIGDLLPDQRAGSGAHIVARGWDPSSNRRFQVWDRQFLRGQVEALSGGDSQYVYLYRAVEQGKPSYRVVTAQGEFDLKDRSLRAPGAGGGGPDYVVVVAEPHAEREGNRVVEPGWEAVRGGGGGAEKPPGDGSGSLAGDPDGGDPGGNDRRNDGADGGGDGGGKRGRTAVLRTVDIERAHAHLAVLRGQKPLKPSEVTILEEGTSLSSVHFSPSSGEHAGMVVFLARNVDQFRRDVAAAARDGKLENKQIGLITCGDAWDETPALRETLLASGALLVWTPDRQITPQAGRMLVEQIRTTLGRAEAGGIVFRDLDALITHAIREVTAARKDADASSLWDSSSYVRLEDEDLPGGDAAELDHRS